MVTHADQEQVRTLQGAHEQLHREWPGHSPSTSAELAYHQRAAALFAQVAETDSDHHHEALFWAQQERAAAKALEAQGEPGPT